MFTTQFYADQIGLRNMWIKTGGIFLTFCCSVWSHFRVLVTMKQMRLLLMMIIHFTVWIY